MQILFDNGTPRGLARYLTGHTVVEARTCDWDSLFNGELIAAAELAGFDLMITTDKTISISTEPCHTEVGDCGSRAFAVAHGKTGGGSYSRRRRCCVLWQLRGGSRAF
jgi:hypothetical protein